MASNKITQVSGRAIVIRGDDIDTDRIIPARFLKEITFSNLGKYPFYDERFNADGSEKDHPLNKPFNQGARILFVNKNFGCGSSREHAPQALLRWGIKAIAGESFAEIFSSNCNTIGIPVLRISENTMRRVQKEAESRPELEWIVDLNPPSLRSDSLTVQATMPEQNRTALADGLWNSTDLLLGNSGLVDALSKKIPYMNNYGA